MAIICVLNAGLSSIINKPNIITITIPNIKCQLLLLSTLLMKIFSLTYVNNMESTSTFMDKIYMRLLTMKKLKKYLKKSLRSMKNRKRNPKILIRILKKTIAINISLNYK